MRLPLNKRLVEALIEHSKKTPYFHLPEYMERYWLLPYKKLRNKAWKRFLFGELAARVHHILRSDDDRNYHDHPWNFITVILKGGYWEVKPIYDKSGIFQGNSRIWYGAGSVRFVRAKTWHRLELPYDSTAWTLFITFKYRQRWGFLMNPNNKMHYQEYLGIRGEETNPIDSSVQDSDSKPVNVNAY